jgi:hypothetical protein
VPVIFEIDDRTTKKAGGSATIEPPAYQGKSHIKTYIDNVSDDFRKKFGRPEGRPSK